MNRTITNAIRFVMDECIPPIIRDSRWFMYPFFYYWFKGKNVRLYMDFKDRVRSMTSNEFEQCYRELDCRATDRPTDLNQKCIDYILKYLDAGSTSLLDAGCGRGHWLNLVQQHHNNLSITGCDFFDSSTGFNFTYEKANIESLPFADNSFDIVTCFHTIEHVRNLEKAIAELKRVARKQLIIVTPKQRPYYYTLDLHLHYFPFKGQLEALMGLEKYSCQALDGDWCYIGYK
jgi:ubiquinone/menaquinone biosynthesis C-methylase UbiE